MNFCQGWVSYSLFVTLIAHLHSEICKTSFRFLGSFSLWLLLPVLVFYCFCGKLTKVLQLKNNTFIVSQFWETGTYRFTPKVLSGICFFQRCRKTCFFFFSSFTWTKRKGKMKEGKTAKCIHSISRFPEVSTHFSINYNPNSFVGLISSEVHHLPI
jgi:hypothetical protein